MLIERSTRADIHSNSYLVADGPGGNGLLIDAGAPPQPLLDRIAELELTVTHLFLTHHHGDHVEHAPAYKQALGVEVLAHPAEARLIDGVDRTIEAGDELFAVGELTVGALHTPGHTAGMLNPVIDGTEVFTGDTLFRGSVGGVRAPGSTGFADIRHSVMDVLMGLAPQTRLHPGHSEATTVEREWEQNPFVRVWRGVAEEAGETVTALGSQARLVVMATDYDGGYKAWVRWPDGTDDIVPGSKVAPAGDAR